jgi:hypothetical protein
MRKALILFFLAEATAEGIGVVRFAIPSGDESIIELRAVRIEKANQK